MNANMGKMLKQVQDMQKKLAKKQEELAEKVYEATAGGGMVTVEVNGRSEVVSIKIDDEVMGGGDKEMLQDLIVAGVNEALRRAGEAQQEGMMGLMGNSGLKIPGLF